MTLEQCEQTIHACRNGLVGVRYMLAKLDGVCGERWQQLRLMWELKERFLLATLEELNGLASDAAEAGFIDHGYDDDYGDPNNLEKQ